MDLCKYPLNKATTTTNDETFRIFTEVGFDEQELLSTKSEDLSNIKAALYSYLKSKKLKKRNANYKNLYSRVCKELKRREGKSIVKPLGLINGVAESFTSNFLGKKKRIEKINNSLSDLIVPSFFNDKCKKGDKPKVDYISKPVENFHPFLEKKSFWFDYANYDAFEFLNFDQKLQPKNKFLEMDFDLELTSMNTMEDILMPKFDR
jgi:hypothetical protein